MDTSKPLLSIHQLRAMVQKINATIDSHDHKPATARNLKALADAQARAAKYSEALQAALYKEAELQSQRDAAAAAQATEPAIRDEVAAVAAQVEHDMEEAHERREAQARDRSLAKNAPTTAERREARARLADAQHEANRRWHQEQERKKAARAAAAAAKLAAGPRRKGSSRKHYPDPNAPYQKAIARANQQAGHATARAVLAGDQRPEGKQTEPDAELAVSIRELLNRYTSGCVIDMCWATERELWDARRKEATA